jgi:hypothetical protein
MNWFKKAEEEIPYHMFFSKHNAKYYGFQTYKTLSGEEVDVTDFVAITQFNSKIDTSWLQHDAIYVGVTETGQKYQIRSSFENAKLEKKPKVNGREIDLSD